MKKEIFTVYNTVIQHTNSDDGFSHQINGTLEKTGSVQDFVHDGGLELVGVELFTL